jgi:hypothetical protein
LDEIMSNISTLARGWEVPFRSKKFHYFYQGVSICHSGKTIPAFPHLWDFVESDLQCKACAHELERYQHGIEPPWGWDA